MKMPRMPKTLADCVEFSAWAAIHLARGNISHQDAHAMRDAIKEVREALGARDADDKLAEARRLLAEMKALRAAP